MAEKFLFISMSNPKNQAYYCKKCVYHGVGPFLCISTMKSSGENCPIKTKGCLLMNSSQDKIPFYGYKCCECQAKNEKSYFSCTDCHNIWRRNCFESIKDCMEAGHSILLENSPFSFWSKEISQNESNHLKFQTNLIKKHHMFQQAQMYFESHEYRGN